MIVFPMQLLRGVVGNIFFILFSSDFLFYIFYFVIVVNNKFRKKFTINLRLYSLNDNNTTDFCRNI